MNNNNQSNLGIVQYDSLLIFLKALKRQEPDTVFVQTYLHQSPVSTYFPTVDRTLLFTARYLSEHVIHSISIPVARYVTMPGGSGRLEEPMHTEHERGLSRGEYLMGWLATNLIEWTVIEGLLSVPNNVTVFHGRVGFDYPAHLRDTKAFRMWLDADRPLIKLED